MNVAVPYDALHPDTLQSLIEEFVTRDGAVHGHSETHLPQQIEAVRVQLIAGKVVILFDDETESCTICSADQWKNAPTDEGDIDREINERSPF